MKNIQKWTKKRVEKQARRLFKEYVNDRTLSYKEVLTVFYKKPCYPTDQFITRYQRKKVNALPGSVVILEGFVIFVPMTEGKTWNTLAQYPMESITILEPSYFGQLFLPGSRILERGHAYLIGVGEKSKTVDINQQCDDRVFSALIKSPDVWNGVQPEQIHVGAWANRYDGIMHP